MVEVVPMSATVYTPSDLAEAMVAAVSQDEDLVWLDPCVGTGAFASVISRVMTKRSKLINLDIRERIIDDIWVDKGARGIDFISWSLAECRSVDRVVMNPPYVAMSKLSEPLRSAARSVLERAGLTVSDRHNYWSIFMVAATSVLRDRGQLCAVLPASWDFADYSKAVKHYLYKNFETIEVYRSGLPLFQDVKDGSIVIVCRNYGVENKYSYRFDVANRTELIAQMKKTKIINNNKQEKIEAKYIDGVELGEIAKIRIGAVSGDSGFFLLTDQEKNYNKIPDKACIKVVSKSRHIRTSFVGSREWDKLKNDGEKVWLFNPPDDCIADKNVEKYIKLGEAGACNMNSYKIMKRNENWWKFSVDTEFHAFISGMSSSMPHLTMKSSTADIGATNTLYTVTFNSGLTRAQRYGVALSMLEGNVRKQLNRSARIYAQGLKKHEPSDILRIKIRLEVVEEDVVERFHAATKQFLSLRGSAQPASSLTVASHRPEPEAQKRSRRSEMTTVRTTGAVTDLTGSSAA